MDGVPKHCLFHVNGPVAALPLQFGHNNGKHCVVPFWGSIFDANCAAYIPPSSDERALEELRLLFQREKDPLNLVFLSPRYMTPDAQIFYEKLETVHFVDEIADALKDRDGTHIVVMLPGERLVPSVDKIPQEFQGFHALNQILRNHADKLTYVISDVRYSLPDFAACLRQQVGKLWWQDSGLQWHDVGYP
jgi:hypothetical protein